MNKWKVEDVQDVKKYKEQKLNVLDKKDLH